MPPRTGFEGYCEACGHAFQKVAASDGATPKVLFGTELFGYERFFQSAIIRSRTWHLRGTNKGASNRFSVFQGLWLSTEQLAQANAVESGIACVKAQVRQMKDATRWTRERQGEIAKVLRTDGADRRAYVSAISQLACDIGLALASPGETTVEGVPSTESGQPFGEWRESLAALMPSLSGADLEDATKAELRGMLDHARTGFTRVRGGLALRMGELSQAYHNLVRERERIEADLPAKAVSSCVDAMLEDKSSLLWNAMNIDGYGFVNSFSCDVVPSIEEGFRAEGYPEERIAHFRHRMDDHMNALSLARGSNDVLFEAFLCDLVYALVYGPTSAGAGAGTVWEDTFELEIDEPIGRQIMLCQLFTPDGRFVGKTGTYNSDDMIFVGRSDEIEKYKATCDDVLARGQGERSIYEGKDIRLFVVSEEHGQVSNLHGVFFFEDETWVFLDFSRFGTRVIGPGKGGVEVDTFLCRGFREIGAGSTLFLGARTEDEDERRLYRKAAAIRLSFFLDEENVVYNTL